jgi:SAM-dependent methyltransferase
VGVDTKYRWEGFLPENPSNGFQRLWRIHSDAINAALIDRWQPEKRLERALKTDLFDEAVHGGLVPSLTRCAKQLFCTDVSFKVHRMAKRRYPNLPTVSADVRCLPFREQVFDGIVSNSTLDHFENVDDISTALRELHRVLQPGGQLILTLDNPANPIVFLRNHLPYPLLRKTGTVPYYVGRSLNVRRLRHLLERLGFRLLETDSILHSPRMPAIILANWMEKWASVKTQHRFLSFLMHFEKMSKLPTRFLTGYFIAVRCVKT